MPQALPAARSSATVSRPGLPTPDDDRAAAMLDDVDRGLASHPAAATDDDDLLGLEMHIRVPFLVVRDGSDWAAIPSYRRRVATWATVSASRPTIPLPALLVLTLRPSRVSCHHPPPIHPGEEPTAITRGAPTSADRRRRHHRCVLTSAPPHRTLDCCGLSRP